MKENHNEEKKLLKIVSNFGFLLSHFSEKKLNTPSELMDYKNP